MEMDRGMLFFFIQRSDPLFEFFHLCFLSGDVKNFEVKFPRISSHVLDSVLENCRVSQISPPEYNSQDVQEAISDFYVEFENWHTLVSKPTEHANEEQPQT